MNKVIVSLLAAAVLTAACFGFVVSHQKAPTSGSITSPDAVADHFSENGIVVYPFQVTMNSASTTLCSFVSPAATTSLMFLSASINSATTTATTVVVGYGTSRTATTTQIGSNYALASGATAQIVASTSPTTGTLVLAPSSWVNVSQQGGIGTFSPTGMCQARFLQL